MFNTEIIDLVEKKANKKILIIGGGTGQTSAYMLEHMTKNFDVTLVEKSSRLGGHIYSIDFGDHGIAEGGAEFIGSPESYPNFHRLCKELGVKLLRYELNADLHKISIEHSKDEHILLPPIYHKTETTESYGCLSCLFNSNTKKQNKTIISLNTILKHFAGLLELEWAILRAKYNQSPENIEDVETLEEFVVRFKKVSSFLEEAIDQFADQLLYPMVAAAWGVAISEAKKFCAHYAMNYFSLSQNWYDAPKGLSSYMQAMQDKCKHLDTRLNTEVVKLICVNEESDEEPKYKAQLSDESFLSDEKGNPVIFDEVIISTPAYATKNILPDIDNKEMKELKQTLDAVKYYKTTLVFHTDESYETPNNTVIHTRVEGDYAANTAQKKWKAKDGATAVMKTWVLPGQKKPAEDKILQECHYMHPYMDKNYFIAQQALHKMQKKYGLHFGGILGGRGDSHEDATIAALQISRNICKKYNCLKKNSRLKDFLDENGYVNDRNTQLSTSHNILESNDNQLVLSKIN